VTSPHYAYQSTDDCSELGKPAYKAYIVGKMELILEAEFREKKESEVVITSYR
jgi:hypothetical protein